MSRRRFTIEELKTWSDTKILNSLVLDRMSECTNPYAPLYQRLEKLHLTLYEQLRKEQNTNG